MMGLTILTMVCMAAGFALLKESVNILCEKR